MRRKSVRCAPDSNTQHQRYYVCASSPSPHQNFKTPTFLPRTSMCIASKDTNHAYILPHYSPVSFPHASFVGVSKGLVCRRTSSTTSLSTGWLWSNVLKARYGCSLCSPRTGHRMYIWHLQQQNTQNTLSNDTFKFLDRTPQLQKSDTNSRLYHDVRRWTTFDILLFTCHLAVQRLRTHRPTAHAHTADQ